MATEALDVYAAARVRARRSWSVWLRWRERRLLARLKGRRPCGCELARLAAARTELRRRADARSRRG